jgi:hypothetical protein
MGEGERWSTEVVATADDVHSSGVTTFSAEVKLELISQPCCVGQRHSNGEYTNSNFAAPLASYSHHSSF